MHSKKSNPKLKAKGQVSAPDLSWSFEAIGTIWWIGFYQQLEPAKLHSLKELVTARIEQFDVAYSRFRDDSLVTKIAKQAGTYNMPEDAAVLFSAYRQLYNVTDGAVTPLIGQTLSDAGYDAQYSLIPKDTLALAPAWDDVMQYEHQMLTLRSPQLLDFGAAGKGYLVDIISEILEELEIYSYSVDASGDMLHAHSSLALRVGLEHPEDPDSIIGYVDLLGRALCGSAGNRRAWGAYHHIIDPKTGVSPRRIAAVWVVADTALIADGLTTALFFAEPATLATVFSFEYVILSEDGSVAVSENFPGVVFTDQTKEVQHV